MKRVLQTTLALGALVLAGSGTISAQSGASFHLGGGVVMPQGNFNDAFKTGWQAVAGVSFGLQGAPFLVRLDAFYGQHRGDFTQVGPDVKQKFVGGLLGAQAYFSGPGSAVAPYFIGQAGLTNAKLEIAALDDSETKFSLAGGLGLTFDLGGVNLFVEGKYFHVFTSDGSTGMFPILAGFKFGGR